MRNYKQLNAKDAEKKAKGALIEQSLNTAFANFAFIKCPTWHVSHDAPLCLAFSSLSSGQLLTFQAGLQVYS
jgi:hypothetical protein